MKSRMPNPALTVPGAMQAMLALSESAEKRVPKELVDLLSLRASQINGCGFCVDMHAYDLKAAGETDLRTAAAAAWRDAPNHTDAERAALALTEAAAAAGADRPDPVPDDIWEEAARHYDQPTLSGLVIAIAMINAWNRINVPIRQVAGAMRAEKTLDAVGAGVS